MRRVRAAWLLPVSSPPIRDGWLEVEAGRITDVGGEPCPAQDLGSVALLPGLVNAHTHLELSHLRNRVPRSESLPDWVRVLLRLRREAGADGVAAIEAGVRRGIDEARASGTVLVGDVANSLVSVPLLSESGMAAQVFLELIGFSGADPAARVRQARDDIGRLVVSGDRVRVSLAAHAPYSVSPALFREIRADLDRSVHPVSSVHLAESPEEVEFLAKGTGPWRVLLEDLGADNPGWSAPGKTPVEYLDSLQFLDRRVLVAHGVQCTGEDLRRLQVLGMTIVSCPRSNQYVGAGVPPLEAFYAMDVNVAFGTDSLVSAPSLSLFDELAEARRLAPRVPASALLRSATLIGAEALGFAGEYGSLEPGKSASVIAVRVPPDIHDVEEYLVGGVPPADVFWPTSD